MRLTARPPSRIPSTPTRWRPACARSWPRTAVGRAAPPTCCVRAPISPVMASWSPTGPQIRARSPAACAAPRPFYGRSASRSPSVARAAPVAELSECAGSSKKPSAPSAPVSTIEQDHDQDTQRQDQSATFPPTTARPNPGRRSDRAGLRPLPLTVLTQPTVLMQCTAFRGSDRLNHVCRSAGVPGRDCLLPAYTSISPRYKMTAASRFGVEDGGICVNQNVSKTVIATPSLLARGGRLAWLSPPPLLGEDPAAYDELLGRISGAVKPSDVFEEIWVQDIVDLAWEVVRLRRLSASLMTATAHKAVQTILEPFIPDYFERESLAKAWGTRDKAAVKQIDNLLAAAGMSIDVVMAQTLSINLDDIERIDRMIATAEARRNLIMREIERHRATWAQDFRQAAQEAEESSLRLSRIRLKQEAQGDHCVQDSCKPSKCPSQYRAEDRRWPCPLS